MRMADLRHFLPLRRFWRSKRGVAAVEFAFIAPALVGLSMGVFEMSFRFRASEEASRYVHQYADIVSRETALTTTQLRDLYEASVNLMRPVETTSNLDVDVSSIGFVGATATPQVYWRRVAGAQIDYALSDVNGMGIQNETVILVSIRYRYKSVLTTLFGGDTSTMIRTAYARPRITRVITLGGVEKDDGTVKYF